MAILSSVKTNITVVSKTVIKITEVADANANANANADTDADADTVPKLMKLTLGGISVGTFSVGSVGAAYRDQLLAGAHNQAYVVTFFIGLAVVYLVSVGQMLASVRWVSLDSPTAGKITCISILLLLVLVAFSLLNYYLINKH